MTATAQHSEHRLSAGRSWLGLLAFGLAVFVAAGLGSLAAQGSSSTYDRLELPAFAPPSWLFGPAWTVLYIAIAIAGWLVWRRVGFDVSIGAWVLQLVLNAAWTPLFFAADRYALAFVELCAMWLAIATTAVLFWSRHRVAAVLLLPYLGWVSYAGALNLAIWQLN